MEKISPVQMSNTACAARRQPARSRGSSLEISQSFNQDVRSVDWVLMERLFWGMSGVFFIVGFIASAASTQPADQRETIAGGWWRSPFAHQGDPQCQEHQTEEEQVKLGIVGEI
jgi:hypothetical protein